MGSLTQIVILLMLILLNAFFAGSELAFISLNQTKMRVLADDRNRRARLVLKLIEIPTNFLSAIQIGVSLASMLSGAFAADTFADLLATWVVGLSNGQLSYGVVRGFSVLVITLITMYLMLVLGELVPKRIAMANPERFAFFVVYPVWMLARLFTPLVKLLAVSTNLLLHLIGIDPNKQDEVTEEEIRIMVEAGEINISEKEMIRNVFEFDNHLVADIMTHRTEIIAVENTTEFEELLELVDLERFTRYPVYEESIDNIVGILHLRDLLSFLRSNEDPGTFKLNDVIREPYFVPESKRTNELFAELKANKTHIAVVIDEYGGTAGIVTLEDLIEEVMGNIMDEYDEEELETIREVYSNEWLVEGYADIDDLESVIGAKLPVEDYDTVSGFVVSELGRIPTPEDVNNKESEFVYNGYRFAIVEIEEKVVSKVRIMKEETAEIEEDDE